MKSHKKMNPAWIPKRQSQPSESAMRVLDYYGKLEAAGEPCPSYAEVAEALEVEKSNIEYHVQRLIRFGHLVRVHRFRAIELTPQGAVAWRLYTMAKNKQEADEEQT